MTLRWKTKDGRIIDVRKMSDSHLKNTLRFVMRAKRGAEESKALLCNAWIQAFALELAKRELDRIDPEWSRPE